MLKSKFEHSNNEFNQRKKLYIERLMNNPELITFIVKQDSSIGKKYSKVIFNPKNIKELEIAEISYPYVEDVYSIVTSKTNVLDMENNVVFDMLVDIIKKLKAKQDVSLKEIDDIDELARLGYDAAALMRLNKNNKLYKYIVQECELNDEGTLKNVLKNMKYVILAVKYIRKCLPFKFDNITKCSDEDLQLYNQYINEFHKIYQEDFQVKQEKAIKKIYKIK